MNRYSNHSVAYVHNGVRAHSSGFPIKHQAVKIRRSLKKVGGTVRILCYQTHVGTLRSYWIREWMWAWPVGKPERTQTQQRCARKREAPRK